jgi:leucyl-tRNA synthetase
VQRYNPKEIEPRWQQTWKQAGSYKAADFDERPKFVMLTEFPYPSGDGLHLGHTREYTLADIIARHKRMMGYNVLYPMGYDAFGLPTENYAIKHKIAPQVATGRNVANFQKQFESLGYSIDWDRSFRTTDPDYYRWTQWLFLQFYNAGLAYQDEIAINWCPHCKTGLANEEVQNGRHERCDTLVEKKLLKQWLLKITQYADRLIDGLGDVDYPSRIADQQVNWIGRSKGAEITFAVDGHDESVTVFTTRADTIFGATFLVLAPEHPLVRKVTTAEHKSSVNNYIKVTQEKTDLERQDAGKTKTGVATGAYAVNPANGKKIPIWIADYVLMGYGTGAIMAVPAHDERDFAFATKYELPIIPVVAEAFGAFRPDSTLRPTIGIIARDSKNNKYCVLRWVANPEVHGKSGLEFPGGGVNEDESWEQAALREFAEETGYTDVTFDRLLPAAFALDFTYKHDGEVRHKRMLKFAAIVTVNSPDQDGSASKEAYEADASVEWLTRDELKSAEFMPVDRAMVKAAFSHEPFHGEGIIVNSGDYDGLPSAEMRDRVVADLAEKGVAQEKIQYRLRDWIFSRQHYWGEPIPIIHCDEHGAVPVPEDQLPVVLPEVDHYEPTDTGESPLAAITEWVNTACPICGQPARRETDTMPNWAGSSWYYLRYFDARNDSAFADQKKLAYWGAVDLYLGGMEHTTLHLLYSRFWHQFFYDQGLVPTPEPYMARRGQGIILAADGSKMSKSKGNVVNPTEIIDSGYGADALRLAIAFLAPYDQTTAWSPESVAGTHRLLQRIWALVQEFSATPAAERGSQETPELLRAVHKAIKKVSEDIASMSFNTAIAALMELTNELFRIKADDRYSSKEWGEVLPCIVQLLAPFAPHIAEEMWHQLGNTDSVHASDWPEYDEKYLQLDTLTIAIQVNGKLRGEVKVAQDAAEGQVIDAAKADERARSYIEGKEIRKTIYVPGRLVNFVV